MGERFDDPTMHRRNPIRISSMDILRIEMFAEKHALPSYLVSMALDLPMCQRKDFIISWRKREKERIDEK